jgi:hypothetical protein
MGALRRDLVRRQVGLDALGDRAVVIDEHGDAWQKSGYLGLWYRAFDGDGVDSFALAQRVGVWHRFVDEEGTNT